MRVEGLVRLACKVFGWHACLRHKHTHSHTHGWVCVQGAGFGAKYQGLLHCMRTIHADEGGIRALYKGVVPKPQTSNHKPKPQALDPTS